MSKRKLLVTGSSGLIGSEICFHFSHLGWQVCGLDNNQREVFFGTEGNTRWNQRRLECKIKEFQHFEIDVRDRNGVRSLVQQLKPDAIVHAAAQPSHDLAAKIPLDDFDTNAVGTLNLLEAARCFVPESPFVFFSTNKVYGDGPNRIKREECKKRWIFSDLNYADGISETFPIDQCKHSLFGVSKLAADILVQEYGYYFGLKTCCLRGGCLTGPNHSGVELHGFLSFLIKCNLERQLYRVFGYKGKQVRDNIHSYDVARFVEEFIKSPRCAQVYNLGGGKDNTCSILEAFDIVSSITGIDMQYKYVDAAREGDHICYFSDLRKCKEHYPNWGITKSLGLTMKEMVQGWVSRK